MELVECEWQAHQKKALHVCFADLCKLQMEVLAVPSAFLRLHRHILLLLQLDLRKKREKLGLSAMMVRERSEMSLLSLSTLNSPLSETFSKKDHNKTHSSVL